MYVRDYAVCLYRGSGICISKEYFDPPIYATMFKNERYKLNVYHNLDMKTEEEQGELYDMLEDPAEMNNLWYDRRYEKIKKVLLKRLMDWLVY